MANIDRGELPPFMATNIGEEIEVQEEVWYHNWLYSVVPVSQAIPTGWNETIGGFGVEYPLIAALVGYCKNCGKGFSQEIPSSLSGAYEETQLQVNKTGCVAPQTP